MAPRILLCGDVLGHLNQLFKRVSSVNKSAGPFDALLCVGQFFPDSPEQLEDFTKYIEGGSHFPLPTYFIGDYGVAATKILLQASKDSANQGFKMDGFEGYPWPIYLVGSLPVLNNLELTLKTMLMHCEQLPRNLELLICS